MVEQEQKKNLENIAEDMLEEQDIVDMFINDKITTEELFEPVASIPSYFGTDSSDLKARVKEFEKKYYGTPDTVETKEVKGTIPTFLEKLKTKYFGGEVEEVIKGEPGMVETGRQIYNAAVNQFQNIKGDIKNYKSDIIKQENYLNKLRNTKSKHDDLYLKFEKKEKQTNDIIEKIQTRMDEDTLNLSQRKKLTYILNDLHRRKENIELRTDEVSYSMVGLNSHITNLTEVVKANKGILNRVQSELQSTELNLQYFDLMVTTIPTTAGLSTALPEIQTMGKKLSGYMSEFHNDLMENISTITETEYNNTFITEETTQGLNESVGTLMDKMKYDRQSIRNAAKSTIFKKD